MPEKKKSRSAEWVDPEAAPELTDAFFDRAEIQKEGKQAAQLKLDADALAAYRNAGARSYQLTDEQVREIVRIQQEIREGRGVFATDEEMTALWNSFTINSKSDKPA